MKFLLLVCLLASLANPSPAAAQTVSGINVVWEAETTTPVNYLGKSLPSGGSKIRVVALPYGPNQAGLPLEAKDFTFKWSKDGLTLPDGSGPGKNSLSYSAAGTGNNVIEVVAESKTNKLSFAERLVIPVSQPELLWYESDPLWGTLGNRALANPYYLTKPELAVVAVPYFFDLAAARAGQLSYSWLLNKKPISADTGHANLVTFLKPNNYTAGDNEIGVTAQNLRNPNQSTKNTLRIIFNQ